MNVAWQDIIEMVQQYTDKKIEYWFNENLFTPSWWVLFIVTVGLLVIWIIIVDRQKILEIVTYGLMVMVIATLGDTIGLYFLLWGYPNSLVPIPTLTEVHTFQMPIIYMIIYQYFNTWKSFLIVVAINAFGFAFILEPLLVWLKVYELYQWKYIYSLIPYFVIAVMFKWIVQRLKQLDQNSN